MENNNRLTARPWFLTVTTKWTWSPDFSALKENLATAGVLDHLPFHHILLRDEIWHLTIATLLKVDQWADNETGEQSMQRCFQSAKLHLERLEDIAFAKFELFPFEVRCYDSGTAVQFKCEDDALALLRDRIRVNLGPVMERVAKELGGEGHGIRATFNEPRNHGSCGYGSIARSPFRLESGACAWIRPLSRMRMRINKISIAASDEAFVNELRHLGKTIDINAT
jgi:hypothetical protein